MKTVFVSSTFKDFQAERDILNDRVRPELNIHACACGETVGFCDLRWGIDTSTDSEEAATQKILSVCMDQIDRSSPYMIVLLGDRYGYIPGAGPIREALEQRSNLGLQLEDLEISITQLEIEYGLLSRPENRPHVYIYVRHLHGDSIPADYTCESDLHRQKLDALLRRIQAFAQGQVRHYDLRLENGQFQGLSEFAQRVGQDLLTDLQAEWAAYKDMPPFRREELLQWKQIGDKKDRLRIHADLADSTIEQILSDRSRFWALQGRSGSGKSVMLSYICHRLRQQGMTVIPALCQSSPITGDPSVLLEYLIFHLENALERPHRTFSLGSSTSVLTEKSLHRQKLEHLEALCAAVPEDGPKVILALDALDQLYPRQMSRYNAVLPNTVSGGVRILVTATTDFQIPGHYHVSPLKELSGDAIMQAIGGIQTNYKKTINPDVCRELCSRPAAGNLLYLTMAMMRLCLMNRSDFDLINARGGGMDQIRQRQQEIVKSLPDNAEELAVHLLDSTANMDSGAGIRQALFYIAASRSGLRPEDLEQLLREDDIPFAPLDLYVYTHILQEFFLVRQNGCIDFQHKVIRQGLLKQLGENLPHCHSRIFDHLQGLPATDPVKNAEILYHAYYSGNGDFIPRHIAAIRLYDYYQTLLRIHPQVSRDLLPKDFSPDTDYAFLCQQYAADLHTIIMTENAAHLEELVEMIISLPPEKQGQDMSPIFWTEFLNKMLPSAFGESDDELRMQYAIFSCVEVYATQLCENFPGELTAKKNLALCCLRLAQISSKNRNVDMSETAVEYIRKYCDLLGQIIDENKSVSSDQAQEYAEGQNYLMTLLLQGSRREDMPEVLRIGEGLLKLYEDLGMPEQTSRIHFNMGMAYEHTGGAENRENAFQHYMQAIQLSGRYAEEKKDNVSITYRILSTLKLGNMCLEVENYSYALSMFYVALQRANEAYERLRDGHSRQYVLMAQEGIGMAMLGMGGDHEKQGKTILISTLVQSMELLKQYSNPGVEGMCSRIKKALGL